MLLFTFLRFSKIVTDEFSDITENVEILDDRLKICFRGGWMMEVRYPVDDKYSFHLRAKGEIYRIDTAPHHPEISTYPRHIHFKREDRIIEDRITNIGNSPEENFREAMVWVRGLLTPYE